jgi:hypothetical protein
MLNMKRHFHSFFHRDWLPIFRGRVETRLSVPLFPRGIQINHRRSLQETIFLTLVQAATEPPQAWRTP